MKKTILLLISLILIAVFVCAPVFGAEDSIPAENEAINKASLAIKEKYGIEAYLICIFDDETPSDAANILIEEEGISTNYIVLAVSESLYYCEWSEDLDTVFNHGDDDYILYSIIDYNDDGKVVFNPESMSTKYYSLLDTMLCNRLNNPYKYIADQAGVLSDTEKKAIDDKLQAFREENEYDVVIVTVTGISPDDRMEYADDYYDYNGYGYGDDKDGVLLLVNIDAGNEYFQGNSWISTCGKLIDPIDDDAVSSIGGELTPLLLEGKYYDAVNLFPDLICEEVSDYNRSKVIFIVFFAGIFSVIVACLYTNKLKKALKSVRYADNANDNIVDGSMSISRSYDNFLYSHVSKTARPSSSSSSSSSSHTSSSGTSHGGGGF